MSKAVLFSFLIGLPATVGWAIFIGFTGILGGFVGGLVGAAVPLIVGAVYKKLKPDLTIFDRLIVVVLSVVLAFPGFIVGIMIYFRDTANLDLWATVQYNILVPAIVVVVGAIIAPVGNVPKKDKAE